ncbi:hypothetical protein K4K51_009014 [Colletotrichum sp. SAR 10_75]|nr:hypothetical protein K4K51_009014 [Colletotrichum sp. SAR 10_75]
MASDIKLSTQDDLDVIWLRVVREFEKETGSRLQPANGAVLSISDVIDGIDPHKHVPESTKNKAIRVTQSILTCVQVFGGFVASAASGVFGPSQQCFSALNHVITSTQKYSKVFEDLTTLLERVSVFLETLSNYLDEGDAEVKLDKRLRPNVYRVLEHFLVILTLTTRLAKRREKAKLFGKLLIAGDDEGVTAALATLETRVVDVTRVQITTIGKDLSVAARGLRSMQGDIDAMLKYDEENSTTLKSLVATESSKASADAIRTWLNLEDTQSWRYQHARLAEKCVRGTGSWLFANDSFAQWKDPIEDAAAIHKITLDPGFDKEKMVANTDDVQELIRKRLASMPIFRQEVTPFKKQQQQETMHTLTVHIQNDFAALDLVFEELERCTNLGQLKEALERVDEDMQVRFGRHIDSLNQSLSKHEILELNAIMACVANLSNIWISETVRGAPIELVQEYVDFSLKTTRLVPLKQQIEHAYHSILVITAEGVVCWRHKELKGYLKERSSDERAMRVILAKRAKRPGILDLEELNLLEKVVQTNFKHVFGAYGTELFDKYGFTEFFASKREPYKVWISYDSRDCVLADLFQEENYTRLCNRLEHRGHSILPSDRIWLVTECENILQILDKTWWALFFAAKHLGDAALHDEVSDINMTEIQKAHDYIKVAISLELLDDEDYMKRYWQEMLPLFAKCQVFLRDLDGARKTYIRMMNSPKSRGLLHLSLFNFFEPHMILELLKAAQFDRTLYPDRA